MRVACIFALSEVNIEGLAQACVRFSPQISVRHPNIIFIEIGKSRSLYSEDSFLARTKVLLKRFKINARISIDSDLPRALARARFDCAQVGSLPVKALLDFADPFGLDPKGQKSMEKMTLALKRLGIHSISQFQTIPANHLPSRFGRLAQYSRQLLTDASYLPWPGWVPPATYEDKLELLPSEHCYDIEPLLFLGKKIIDRLFSRLRGTYLQADRIEFEVKVEKTSITQKPVRSWSFEFISPQRSTSGFLPILRERLNSDLNKDPLEGPAIELICRVPLFSRSQNTQRHFFTQCDDFDEKMGSFFGQMEEYLGKGQVFWADITEERFPEKSWLKTKKLKPQTISLNKIYPVRPTRLFRSPIPVSVIENRILIRGKAYKVLQWSAVERISVGWLDDQKPRNYYRVSLEGGQSIWVFSDSEHHYFAHGYFE
jgi:hypothetical protein